MSESKTYTFNHNTTSIHYEWPSGITGIERIALSAQGDLQRILSAFFATPLHIIPVYSETFTASKSSPDAQDILSASFQTPIMQKRRVLLQCSGRIVCTATSLVRMTSSQSARLFLEEKFAIGQMFQKLDKSPQFELLSVGFGSTGSGDKAESRMESMDQPLWRKYKLSAVGFECEIVEEFPSREMFTRGQDWLVGNRVEGKRSSREIVLTLLLALVAAFELLMLMSPCSRCSYSG